MIAVAVIAGSAVALATAFLVYDARKHRREQIKKIEEKINAVEQALYNARRENPNAIGLHAALRAQLVRLRNERDCI